MCDRCGVDHDQQIADALPEIAYYDAAEKWGQQNIDNELITEALSIWTHSMAVQNEPGYVSAAMERGDSPVDCVIGFAGVMMRAGFIVGVQCAENYRTRTEVEIPSLELTDDQVAEFVDIQTAQRAEEARIRELGQSRDPVLIATAIKELLTEMGIDPNNAQVIELSEQAASTLASDQSASGGDDNKRLPGMYL